MIALATKETTKQLNRTATWRRSNAFWLLLNTVAYYSVLTSLGNDGTAHLKLNIQCDTLSRSYGLGPWVLEMVKCSWYCPVYPCKTCSISTLYMVASISVKYWVGLVRHNTSQPTAMVTKVISVIFNISQLC